MHTSLVPSLHSRTNRAENDCEEEGLWLTPLVENLIANRFFLGIGEAFNTFECWRIFCDLSTSNEQRRQIRHVIILGKLLDVGDQLFVGDMCKRVLDPDFGQSVGFIITIACDYGAALGTRIVQGKCNSLCGDVGVRIDIFSAPLLCVVDLLVGGAVVSGQLEHASRCYFHSLVSLLGEALFVLLLYRHVDKDVLS